jgi:hypothetical protein
MSADGSGITRISGAGLAADVASWSPDSERLIFHGTPTRQRGLLEWLGR